LELVAAELLAAPVVAEDDEPLELLPQAAIKAPKAVAAAPDPIVLPAILRNFLRSTSSRASSFTTPSVGCSAAVLVSVIGFSLVSVRVRAPGFRLLYEPSRRADHPLIQNQ
jgi:hypothetical protein